jgi:hypothetical protein
MLIKELEFHGGPVMKRLLLLLLIPLVAGGQTWPPNSPGSVQFAGNGIASANLGGNHTFFVDAVIGNDASNAHTPGAAWRSVAKVNASYFSPGDTILFQSNQKWVARLIPRSSGTAGSTILFSSYGSGAKPVISRGNCIYSFGQDSTCGIFVTQKYLTFDGLEIDSCRGDGIWCTTATFGNIIRNCAFNYCGNAVQIDGRSCLVTNCTMTNLWYSIAADSSYSFGSVGVSILGSANEVSWNTITNFYDLAPLRASAGGPVYDGCFVELSTWSNIQNCDSNYIHHNKGVDGASFIEMGGNPLTGFGMHWNTYAYNSFTGTARNRHDPTIYLHNDLAEGCCGALIQNLRLFNNTLLWKSPGASTGDGLMGWYSDAAWSSNTMICENNIFVTDLCAIKLSSRSTNFAGSNNIFYRLDGSNTTNVTNGTGVFEDPKFLSSVTPDLHLQSSSPAITGGLNLGYTSDLDGKSIAGLPAIGAYEYGGILSAPSAPVADSSSKITSNGFRANWSPSPGATGFKLDVSTTSGFSSYVSGFQNLNLASVTFYAVSGLAPSTAYYYRIRAYNSGGTSGNSNTMTATTAPSAPPAADLPTGSLTASPDTLFKGGSGILTWTGSNATSASIDNGVGPVSIAGGKISVTADTSKTFILTLTNSAGSRKYMSAITVLSPSPGRVTGRNPVEFSLRQNYPNPFNPSTTIGYELPWASHVTITVYDMLGRAISVLVNDMREAGVYQVRFDGSNLASGAYFYLIQAGSFMDTKRLLLLH